jgi:hypothetical protein
MKYLIAIDTTVCLKFPLGFQLGVLWRVLLLLWQFPSHYLWVSSANFYLELFDTKNTSADEKPLLLFLMSVLD